MKNKKILLPLICLAAAFLIASVAQQGIPFNANAASPTRTVGTPTPSPTGTLTPTPTGTLTPTPTGTPASTLVTVTVDKTQYTPTGTISVTVTNGQSTDITTYQYRTLCTMIFLQWQNPQGKWEDTHHCRRFSLRYPVTLSPNSTRTISLSPPSPNFGRTAGKWATGTYRIAFAFGAITKSSVAYSPNFVIA